jgi:DNA end-binding protein Ku
MWGLGGPGGLGLALPRGKEGRMARPTWKGVISFGMVNVPVHLTPATKSKDVSFRQLHATCKTPLREKRWCPVCDREVPQGEVARGYGYGKGKFVMLSEEDFESLPLASRHTIGLQAFVKEDEIDPLFYDKSYFLEPEEAGLKGYALLQKALEEKGLAAIAKVALQRKERLCALRSVEGALLLDTLHYADEIREEDRPKVPKALVNKRELDVAHSLIEALTEEFDPEQYEDEYRKAVLELIEAKLEDKDPKDLTEEAEPEKPTGNGDLLEALRASVKAVKGGGTKGARSAAKSEKSRKAAARKAVKKPAKKAAPAKRAA